MTDKVQKIREEVEGQLNKWMLNSTVEGYYKCQLCHELLSIIDSVQEETKTDWLQELQEKLDSLSKEDFEKVWAKYKLREGVPVNYAKLNAMLNESLSKETKESWNERLDKKDFRERYRRIAESEAFKKAHEGVSMGDVIPVEGEEPVSGLDNGDMPIERWKQAVKAASNQRSYRSSKGLTETRDDYFVDGVQWADEHPKEEPASKMWHDARETPELDKTILLIAPNGNSSLALWDGKELKFCTLGGGHNVLCSNDKWAYIEDILKL